MKTHEVHTITGTITELAALPQYTSKDVHGLRVRVKGELAHPNEERYDATVELPLAAVTHAIRVGARVSISISVVDLELLSDE